MNREVALGCCGDPRCLGCAWECDPPDADHDYQMANGVLICVGCDNETPRLPSVASAQAVTEERPC